jgi:hypothetical protein
MARRKSLKSLKTDSEMASPLSIELASQWPKGVKDNDDTKFYRQFLFADRDWLYDLLTIEECGEWRSRPRSVAYLARRALRSGLAPWSRRKGEETLSEAISPMI